MKLEFNNLTEMLDFLREIGYKVSRQGCCGICKEDNENETIIKHSKDTLTINPEDFKELPRNPFIPNNPYYPSYPIVTCVKNDPELSKKFSSHQSNLDEE